MSEEETRNEVIYILKWRNCKKAVIEPIIEEEEEEVKPKPKPKTRAKAKIKIVKEPVVEVVEVVEEKPKKIDKLKEIVKCPDCNMDMTVHTLKYIHKRRGFLQSSCKSRSSTRTNPRTNSTTKTKANYRRYCKWLY